jgi:hypothetical protein
MRCALTKMERWDGRGRNGLKRGKEGCDGYKEFSNYSRTAGEPLSSVIKLVQTALAVRKGA